MRLIDIDAIKLPEGFFERVDNVPKFYDWLNSLPTIDAVPVVRCKDCIWSRGFAAFACPMVGRVNLKDDDFCSRGERRANETD